MIEDGRISAISSGEPGQGGGAPAGDDELIDLGERWLAPGYIDTHVHGGGGAQCNTDSPEEVETVARFHARHGTTGFLATTVPAPLDELCAALEAIGRCVAPNLLGAHMEGPFLSREQPGALDPGQFRNPDPRELKRLLAAAPGVIRLMTVAPELPAASALIEQLRGANAVVSVGHSAATYAETRDAVRAGATSATHVFNGMPPFHHRAPGVLGAVLDLPEVSCELICDGVHVDPMAMRLVYKAKGAEQVRLITDAIAAAGLPDGQHSVAGRTVRDSSGRVVLTDGRTIAGSTLTMDTAVQNAVRFLGIPVQDAVRMASTNPALVLGLEGRKGALAAGFDADLVVLSERLDVEAAMVGGRWVEGPPPAPAHA